jgi:hypothetical protein
MGTNCALLLADLFLYPYEADFIQRILKKNEKKLARSFNFTFRYIDDVVSLNNSMLGDFVVPIYPIGEILIGTTNSGISYQLRDIYSICRSAGMLLYINGKFTMVKLKSSL